jgi:hypothetical protein
LRIEDHRTQANAERGRNNVARWRLPGLSFTGNGEPGIGNGLSFLPGAFLLDIQLVFADIQFDDLIKSRFYPVFVIPAKAGIQFNQEALGSRLRESDGFSGFFRDHQF